MLRPSDKPEQVTKWTVEPENDFSATVSIDVSAHTGTAASKERAEGPETPSPYYSVAVTRNDLVAKRASP